MNHNLSCALLTCAEGLLEAGLETIMKDTLQKVSSTNYSHKIDNTNNVSSIVINNICSIIILSQSKIVIDCLNGLLDRYEVEKYDMNGNHVSDDVYINNTYDYLEEELKKTSFHLSRVKYGQYGRMLSSDQGNCNGKPRWIY